MIKSDDVQILLQKGHDASARGRIGQARDAFKKALDLDPKNFDACFFVAATYAQQDNLKMATTYFRRAYEIDSSVPEGAFNLAYSLQLQEQFEKAVTYYKQALQLRRDYHQAFHNLAVVYEEMGQFDDALTFIDQAIESNPQAEESYYNRGSILMKMNRPEDALISLDRALELKPTHVKALNNRGLIHLQQNFFVQAMEDFSNAIVLDPDDADLHFNRAKASSKIKNHAAAVASYRAAIKLKPDFIDSWINIAFELESLKQYKDALPCFERVRKLNSNFPFIDGYIHSCRLHDCDWSRFSQDTEAILKGLDEGKLSVQAHAALHTSANRSQLLKAAEAWARFTLGSLKGSLVPATTTSKKIKIGYFSPDFHSHPVAMLLTRLLELHDRDRFEVYAFSLGIPTRDPWRLRVESAVDHFVNIRDMADADIVSFARREQLDIAIDLGGYTAETRTSILRDGLAPIQVNYLGFSGSMGVEFIHYIIGDPVLIPVEHDEDYAEKVVRLPHCYMPTDPTRRISDRSMTRSEYGLPENKFVFCGFNNVTKLNPLVFDVWMQILKKVPDSVIWLSNATDTAERNLRSFASKHGVDVNRLVFAKREDRNEDHLARQRLADLFLDAFPHNAHATSCDALWAGLPIVTKVGHGFAARVAASLLTSVGLPELIANSDDEYIRIAVEIATVPGESLHLKQKLAANIPVMPLFNIEKYARNIERAYVRMVEQGIALAPITLSDVS